MAHSEAYRENYKLIDWGDTKDWRPTIASAKGPSGPFFMPDIAEFQSPIDHSLISSRSQLREHERRHGVRQCGELKTPQEFSNSERRQTAFNEKRFETAFRTALEKTHGV